MDFLFLRHQVWHRFIGPETLNYSQPSRLIFSVLKPCFGGKMVKALCLLLLSAFIFNLSQANNNLATPLPKPEKSFTLTYIQNEASCSYWVSINTSCASSIFTRDKISLAFGDGSGNQIYASSLEGPESTFKPCSTDVFEIEGPCAKQICSGYLYKSGPDKWIPETVKIYGGYNTDAVTFYYNTTIPDELWYGYSLCQYTTPPPPFPFHHPPPPSSSYRRYAPAGWFVLIITGLVSAF